MAQTPNELFQRAEDVLQDIDNVRWTRPELLRYLNDGRRELAIHRPDLYATSHTLTLAGGTKQQIPADGVSFVDGLRNINEDGSLGRAVRVAERETIDAQDVNWHTADGSTVIKQFMYDERTPRVFFVYPAAAAGHKMEIIYNRNPADITEAELDSTTKLEPEGPFTGALLDIVLYRSLSKDAEYAANMQRATLHYQMFANTLGIGNRKRITTSPNMANEGGTPPKSSADA